MRSTNQTVASLTPHSSNLPQIKPHPKLAACPNKTKPPGQRNQADCIYPPEQSDPLNQSVANAIHHAVCPHTTSQPTPAPPRIPLLPKPYVYIIYPLIIYN
ncbi:hypothetical protein DPMN_025696 [Dreissena polymorpha]|uniref:Uncharacterized protein n=1 Tax=Dreissena polymorpha TaxID=45954 RepID=A0A9D4RC29_DREPO|nr:hypothetical protein DPMN_025696 [Dreissena polymorpha]